MIVKHELMRKIFLVCAAVLAVASCSLYDSGEHRNTSSQSETPGGNGGNGSGNGSGTGTDGSVNPYTAAL